MSAGALVFMLVSWAAVLSLMIWSFSKIMRTERHFDPDGTGPASPPVPGAAESPPRR